MLIRTRTVSAEAVSDALADADQTGVLFLGIAYHEDCKAREWFCEEFDLP